LTGCQAPPDRESRRRYRRQAAETFAGIPALMPCQANHRGRQGTAMSDDITRFADVTGRAALRLWPDLPRDIQEQLFEDAVGSDDDLRYELAVYLHAHHPRTAHPPKPQAAMRTAGPG
jgi:hypothetical protein